VIVHAFSQKHLNNNAMAKKSVIAGEYVIEIADNGHVDVLRIFRNAKETMRQIAQENNFEVDPKWNTQDLGRNLVKTFGDGTTATFKDIIVTRDKSGKIEIYQEVKNVKEALREISSKMDFTYNETWNTQTFGKKLVDFLEDQKDVADKVLQTPNKKSKFEEPSAEESKYFAIRILVDVTRVGRIDVDQCLEDNEDYDSIEEYIENEGIYELSDYEDSSELKLSNVHSIAVAEYDVKPESVLSREFGDDYEEYYSGYECKIESCDLENEGLEFTDNITYWTRGFIVPVAKSEGFDPSKLIISNAGGTIEYDGKEYDDIEDCGGEEEPREFFLNGEPVEEE
jgi:hypothetical protein